MPKNNSIYEKVIHPFKPIFDEKATILILGSFPSVKSRENNFYYGNPHNRFWVVLASLFQEEIPKTIKEKELFLHKYHIALWDVVESCQIIASSDNTITDVKINDLNQVLNKTKIHTIYLNGNVAKKLYDKYLKNHFLQEAILLPSTSPANAKMKINDLVEKWSIIKNNIEV